MNVVNPCEEVVRLLAEKKKTVYYLQQKTDLDTTCCYKIKKGTIRITPRIALRLESINLGNAEEWVVMQARYDLWKEKQNEQL